MGIKCCLGCVAPKRHPGCHSSCPDYLAEKAESDRQKEHYDRDRSITNAIYLERGKKVAKAMRKRRSYKK